MSSPLLGSFIWCELLTTDPQAADGFYTSVVGWKTKPFDPDGTYKMFMAGERPVAGLMKLPDEAKAQGAPPNWMMYIGTPNVDDTAIRQKEICAGGGHVAKSNDLADDPVVHRRETSMRSVARPRSTDRPDHLGPAAPAIEHRADRLRWVLKVAGHHDDGVAGGESQTAGNRHMRSAVPGQADAPYTRISA